ncbi:MAG: hypothetical protein Q4Q06_04760, partial [Bacteroidota bacterium]|nr:hypothetical protein [Bacteroidota bacterium]
MKTKANRQIFLVELSADLVKKLKRGFSNYNAKVIIAEHINDFIHLAHKERIDALILGEVAVENLTLVEEIRHIDPCFPIIFICKNEKQIKRVVDFDKGFLAIKDTVTIKDLNAIINEEKTYQIENSIFSIGKYTFNYKNKLLSIKDISNRRLFQSLTKKEAGILFLLVKKMNRMVLRT